MAGPAVAHLFAVPRTTTWALPAGCKWRRRSRAALGRRSGH